MYDRILVAIDATPTEENRSAQTRAEQIGRLTGATVYVLHVARGHNHPRVTSSAARASACAPPTRTSKARTAKRSRLWSTGCPPQASMRTARS